ncbi:thiopeptide-type bacteriocin biosynthesis protein [Pedobacter cryoconitis]|uniref:Thiopeptide-type bacteriocin biosynthesis protein n=1 Tax=Pedobacter cryoconitis TaxID=188932 RepID=A0A7W9DYI4_9SPHI|nr:lantibiotic dehydratase [Pedobacter cryoconitis]MBB5635229.1 thiopeptide-type bacteriocin biosynthesis protein [Pedobacter cryoconitis]
MLKAKITPFDFYLLRMPALSIDSLFALNKITDSESLIQAIFTLYQSEDLQESIYLASPELYVELVKWLENPQGVRNERLMLTLYKYLLRMSSRCTPYGLFAGFDMGLITAEKTSWDLKNETVKHSRLDMNYVAEITSALTQQSELKTKLTFNPNNSLYKTNNTYRYYEYRLKNKKREYFLVSIKSSKYVEMILRTAQNGAKYRDLQDSLISLSLTAAQATEFLDEIISSQIITSELEPTITGREFFDVLLDKLQDLDSTNTKLPGLLMINSILKRKGNLVKSCKEIESILQEDFPLAKSKDLVQTDLEIKMDKNSLNTQSIGILSKELNELSGLYKSDISSDLKVFKQKFSKRYEEQEIPLLEALDTEAGIGYAKFSGAHVNYTPLIDGLVFPGKKGVGKVSLTPYKQLVFKKFVESQQTGKDKVTISPAELEELGPVTNNKMPKTLFSVGSFVAASTDEIDQGNFKFNMTVFGGASATPLLGRFAPSLDVLDQKLKECAVVEQEGLGDAILAEIVHLPEARIGNILQRPQIRPFEIPFLGNSSADRDHQIPVTDLLISIRNDKIVLRSKRLNKIIIPRLSSAHNYANGISVYKFLCDLQSQGSNFSIFWDWDFLTQQAFLPRVEYKHIILSRARWQLKSSIYNEIKDLKSAEEIIDFRNKYKLPSKVLLTEGDNELLLDFDCPLVMPLLIQHLKKKDAVFYEFLHTDHSQLATDHSGANYLNEVILPFYTQSEQHNQQHLIPKKESVLKRSFPLGSEWTYVKIYCGSKWADTVLTDYLLPMINGMLEDKLIEKWFFIRFNDPEGHLRVRFLHQQNTIATAELINRIQQALNGLYDQRIVCKLQYDTYDREIERYGEKTMELGETIFYNDSKAVINFLNLIEGVEGEKYRWLFAMRGVELLMADFGMSLEQRQQLMEQAFSAFFAEFAGNKSLNTQLNDKFREVSTELNLFMDPLNDSEEIEEAVELFNERSLNNKNALAEFYLLAAEHQAETDFNLIFRSIMPSYIHMFLNRMFIANQRMHELVVYHHMAKYYASLIARRKHSPIKSTIS